MTNAISVKARLKKQAIEDGKTLQDKLVIFGLERTIYRISVSEYAEKFTLKGGIFLYALFDGTYARATKDIDFLAQYMPNDADAMMEVFQNIFSIQCDDAIVFDVASLKVINITEFKKYRGVNVSIMSYLDRTRVPVSIDIGFGDIVYPDRTKMKFPVLLDMKVPEVYAYSIYSVIAEKFEAIVSLGLANSRYKDFYDIYVLACAYTLDGSKLKNAIAETFTYRGTDFDDIIVFEPGFAEDKIRQNRWNAFIKKKKAMIHVDFIKTINLIKILLEPLVVSINDATPFERVWSKETKRWNEIHVE